MSEDQSTVEYRDVQGFPGYLVGNDGSLWSCLIKGGNGRSLGKRGPWKPYAVRRRQYGGRYVVTCFRTESGKTCTRYVHRLVLEAFVGPCPPGMVACHYDGNSANNAVSNLRWDTQAGNIADKKRHGTAFKSHCRNGHAFTPDNILPSGKRECRICRAAYMHSYYQHRLAACIELGVLKE